MKRKKKVSGKTKEKEKIIIKKFFYKTEHTHEHTHRANTQNKITEKREKKSKRHVAY
jgi:hypothetical protein